MMPSMRTTLILDDALARELQRRAAESGRAFEEVVNEALRRGLSQPTPRRPYRLRTASLGGPRPGVDLTRALALSAALEDDETARELPRLR